MGVPRSENVQQDGQNLPSMNKSCLRCFPRRAGRSMMGIKWLSSLAISRVRRLGSMGGDPNWMPRLGRGRPDHTAPPSRGRVRAQPALSPHCHQLRQAPHVYDQGQLFIHTVLCSLNLSHRSNTGTAPSFCNVCLSNSFEPNCFSDLNTNQPL
ncbi:hypothetical protein BDZ97DRAFT_602878 [Flammula alnicola]|nr:hypothetical protein BDZ97DRAFT_602878 [Flammula alnicola]